MSRKYYDHRQHTSLRHSKEEIYNMDSHTIASTQLKQSHHILFQQNEE